MWLGNYPSLPTVNHKHHITQPARVMLTQKFCILNYNNINSVTLENVKLSLGISGQTGNLNDLRNFKANTQFTTISSCQITSLYL